MDYDITKLGNACYRIDFNDSLDHIQTLGAIYTCLERGMGWELYDVISNTQRCYRAPVQNGTGNYKYVVIGWENNVGVLKVYGGWNPQNHTGTNLCYNSDTYGFAGYSYAGRPMYVLATERYLAICTWRHQNLFFDFMGCFEFSKDNEDEPEGAYFTYAWASASSLIGKEIIDNRHSSWNNLRGYHCLSVPQNAICGAVGLEASKRAVTGMAYLGCASRIYYPPSGVGAFSVTLETPEVKGYFHRSILHGFNIYYKENYEGELSVSGNYCIRGALHGVKLVSGSNAGSDIRTGQIVDIRVDEYGFADGSSIITQPHILLPLGHERSAVNFYAFPVDGQ